jgi:CDP-diglyceride synthetase
MMFKIRKSGAELLENKQSTGKKLFIGGFVLVSAWFFLSRLMVLEEPAMTLYLFLLIWVADIAAYFAGKKSIQNTAMPRQNSPAVFHATNTFCHTKKQITINRDQ